jgi:hypothetical protein
MVDLGSGHGDNHWANEELSNPGSAGRGTLFKDALYTGEEPAKER